MKNLFFLVIVPLLPLHFMYAQRKYEKETRIKEKEVPEKALAFINALGFDRKIKWYKEQGINQITIEAKTKHNSKKYSVEFDSNGQVEDIEIEIKWKAIAPATQTKIRHYLESKHQKVKIRKIQMQYTGNPKTLIDAVKARETKNKPTIRYEIVVKTKTNNKREMIEYLFTEKGAPEKMSIIIFKNIDNLEY